MIYEVMKELGDKNAIEARRTVENIIQGFTKGKDSEWVRNALRALRIIGPHKKHITSDDIWNQLDCMDIYPPNERRAMAAVLTQAKKHQWIKPTSLYVRSSRKVNHGRPIRVWEWVQ